VPYSTADEIEAAVAAAREAFQTWKNTPIPTRARIFLRLQELIRKNMDRLAASVTAELGKTGPDAEGDVFRGLEVVEFYTQTKTVTARWPQDTAGSGEINTAITLK
jgi:malonate-semialdehyde dehydrogenase (acetylating)/methylmalonate-semialdehyde dehydrogenase